jgi:hypothetical protein
MAAPVIYENILGTLIPDVYIKGVTLETSGSPVKESNPHVLSKVLEQRETIATDAAERLYDLAGWSNQLIVTVNISLKESLNESLISSWFGDQGGFMRYLRIKVFQSTKFAWTKRLTENKGSIVFPEIPWRTESQGAVTAKVLVPGRDILGDVGETQKFVQEVDGMLVVKEYPINPSQPRDSSGIAIHDINFRAVFYVPNERPEHLAYFAVSYIDMEQLIEDFDLRVDQKDMNSMNGKVASDIVIRNSEIVSKAWVYKTNDGSTWVGSVHQMDGVLMSGSEHTDNSVPLTKHEVANAKVHDFRNIKEIERLQIDLAKFENTLMTKKNELKLKTNDNTDVKKKISYFTDVYISRDSDGSARFSFGLDFRQYVKTNSIYGKLFEDNTSALLNSAYFRNKIFESAKIRTMKVYRRRIRNIQTLNRLGSPVGDGEVIWDKAETPVLLAMSGERNHKDFDPGDSDFGSLKEISYVMSDRTDMKDMRFFTVMDKTIKDVTDGRYQYGVELEVEDGSFNYLTTLVQDLSTHRRNLYEYYERGSKLGMTKKSEVIDNPHVEHMFEPSFSDIFNPPFQAYDPLTNRFTKAFFLDETRDPNEIPGEELWVKSVRWYLMTVQFMTQSLSDEKLNNLFLSLVLIVHPATGSPKGVMTLIGLLDNLISKIRRVLALDSGTRTVRAIETPRHPNTSVDGKSSKTPVKIFRDTKWFTNHSFDTNIEKNVGLRYLWKKNVNPINTDGLKEFNEVYYKDRVNREIEKYFINHTVNPNLRNYTSGDSLERTSFTFLSPSQFRLSGLSMDLLYESHVYDDSEYSNAEARILAYNWGYKYKPETNTTISQMFSSSMSNLLAGLNTTLVPTDGWEPIAQTDMSIPLSQTTVATQIQTIQGGDRVISSAKSIDPIVEVHTASYFDFTKYDPRARQNSVFSDLSQLFLTSLGGVIGNSNSCVFAPPSATFEDYKTRNYNLNNDNNVLRRSPIKTINSMIKANGDTSTEDVDLSDVNATSAVAIADNMAAAYGIEGAAGGLGWKREQALKSSPNQVKSLFLGSLDSGSVRHTYDDMNKKAAKFRFNQQFIVRVERLVGYKKSFGKRWIKQPIWKPLTKADFYSMGGGDILCRLQKYTCPEIGITWFPGLMLPISDEYFVLMPPGPPLVEEDPVVPQQPEIVEEGTHTNPCDEPSQIGGDSQFASTDQEEGS